MKTFAPLPEKITIGHKYGPAMEVTQPEEAAECFQRLVEHSMLCGLSSDAAIALEKTNLGYFAGYYDQATRERVERLFDCQHPVFGKIADGAPTPDRALAAGLMMGVGLRMARGGA